MEKSLATPDDEHELVSDKAEDDSVNTVEQPTEQKKENRLGKAEIALTIALIVSCVVLAFIVFDMANKDEDRSPSATPPAQTQGSDADRKNASTDNEKPSDKEGPDTTTGNKDNENNGKEEPSKEPENTNNNSGNGGAQGGNGGSGGNGSGGSGGGGGGNTAPQPVWHPGWTEVIHHPAEYQEVWHPAEGHYGSVCNDCGAEISGHAAQHLIETGHNSYRNNVWIETSPGWTEHVVVREAWDEYIEHPGYWE